MGGQFSVMNVLSAFSDTGPSQHCAAQLRLILLGTTALKVLVVLHLVMGLVDITQSAVPFILCPKDNPVGGRVVRDATTPLVVGGNPLEVLLLVGMRGVRLKLT